MASERKLAPSSKPEGDLMSEAAPFGKGVCLESEDLLAQKGNETIRNGTVGQGLPG